MKITALMPGSYHVTDGENALLAGVPPEIIKIIRHHGLLSPQYVLLPDKAISEAESQVAVEFPLYQHLFFSGKKQLQPMVMVGNKRRLCAAQDLLNLTLLGPDESKMRAWGLSPEEAKNLARETRWFYLKDKSGKPMPIEALVETRELEDAEVDLGWIKIRRIEPNVFSLKMDSQTEEVNLNIEEEQVPPYPVTSDLIASSLVKLGVEVLGGATGFSQANASSGLALCYNGSYILIDAIPYLNYHLRMRGIARNQISGIFLTHIHDDHCNVVSLLQYNRKINVLTVPVIFHMMVEKLALTLDRSVERVKKYFTLIPLTPGRETDFFGLKITPHWSIHSIPTIGAEFATEHYGATYRIAFTGDIQSLADIKKMQKAGIIDADRYNFILELYQKPFHLLIADGGEGVLHGDPADALTSQAERIVILHLDDLPDRFQAHFTVASSGKRFSVLHGETDYNLTRTIEFLMEYFPDMPSNWISNLLADYKVTSYNAGDIIIRQGRLSEGHVYMILTGYAQVVYHDHKKKHCLAIMEAGELIGEMSIISGKGRRNASVLALSPVTVAAFSETALHSYIRDQHYESKLRVMWQNRELLQTFSYLRLLQQPVIRALTKHVVLKHLPVRTGPEALENVCAEGGLIFPLGLDMEIEKHGKRIKIPANSQPIFCSSDTKLITEAEFQFLLLRADQAAELRRSIPAFRFFWEEELKLPVPTGNG